MIKFKRQDGGSSSLTPAQPPESLEYGEPAIASDGTFYVGDGTGGVVSKVHNAENGLWEFFATYLLDEWEGSDGDYTQTKKVQSKYGNVKMTASALLGAPQTNQTNNFTTNETKLEALGIINAGYSVPGDGTVTIHCEEKPTCDIDVHWYVKII